MKIVKRDVGAVAGLIFVPIAAVVVVAIIIVKLIQRCRNQKRGHATDEESVAMSPVTPTGGVYRRNSHSLGKPQHEEQLPKYSKYPEPLEPPPVYYRSDRRLLVDSRQTSEILGSIYADDSQELFPRPEADTAVRN